MKLQKAQRQQVKLRIGLSGPSGFGKTYSALLLAYGMTNDWSKIAVIDTENSSASLYAALGNYNTLTLEPPFLPENYIKAIEVCESSRMKVIIIDSISHEWNGEGGCLQIQEQLGGRFIDWAKVTPRHQAFINKILQSSCHVITTTRRKTDYSMDKDANGKTKVFKHGTKEVQREGWEYELTVNFELINDNHLVLASKDRTGLFMNRPEFKISSGTGKLLMNWSNSGESKEEILKLIFEEINKCETVEGLRHVFKKHPEYQPKLMEKIMERKSYLEGKDLEVMPNTEIIKENQNRIDNGTDRN